MLNNIGKDELVRGSIILFILVNVFNFLNYIFHFFMARMLIPADYGILAVLMSLVYIFSIPSEAIQTIISRYTSKFSSNLGKTKSLLSKGIKRGFKLAFLLFLIYIPFAIFLSIFLKIDFLLIILTGGLLFAVFAIPVNRGVLQGRKKFKDLGFNMIIESIIKIVLAVFFVLLGLKVYGAMSGVLIGILSAFFISFALMKEVIKSKNKKIDTKEIYSYGKPVFLVMVPIVLMYSLDIVLARRFFTPDVAGMYAVASVLGKTVFFATVGISKAMFPLASENYEKGVKSNKLLHKSLLITLIGCAVALLFFTLIPKFIVSVLFGNQYIGISGIIFYTGLAFSFLSFSNIIMIYRLRSYKINYSYLLFVFVLLEILLLWWFSQSLITYALALVAANFLMLIGSLFLLKK